jgi:hypothetical protein
MAHKQDTAIFRALSEDLEAFVVRELPERLLDVGHLLIYQDFLSLCSIELQSFLSFAIQLFCFACPGHFSSLIPDVTARASFAALDRPWLRCGQRETTAARTGVLTERRSGRSDAHRLQNGPANGRARYSIASRMGTP